MMKAIFRFAIATFAILLMIAGVVLLISPFPIGIVFFAIGFMLFVIVAPSAVRWLRRRWDWFDYRLHKLEKRLPEFLAKPLRASDYDHDDPTEGEDEEEDEPRRRPLEQH